MDVDKFHAWWSSVSTFSNHVGHYPGVFRWVDSQFVWIEFGVTLFAKGDQIRVVIDRHESKAFKFHQPILLLSDSIVGANLINMIGLQTKSSFPKVPTT